MFIDVTNFTATSRALDSEQVFSWMDETMRVLAGTIAHYDGTIDKYTGDGLMALFGAPHAHENDPERAVRAALDALEAIKPLRERTKHGYGFDFLVRIGINTGAVVAGNVGGDAHREYTVLGDTVNLAARLEKAAAPGTILVSDATYLRTARLFGYEALPPLLVKGVDEPLQTYRPTHPVSGTPHMRGVPGLSSPLIGRESDLERLLALLADTAQQRMPQLALITGDAGVGKSRLVREFELAAGDGGVRFVRAACFEHTQSSPFWLVADMLRALLRLPAASEPGSSAAQLAQAAADYGLGGPERLLYLEYVLGLVPAGSRDDERLRAIEPTLLRRELLSVLRQLFLAAAGRSPTALVLDDLHWIDPASRDVIEHLVQTVSDVPLAVVLIARPEAAAGVIRPLVELAEHTPSGLVQVALDSLSAVAGRRLFGQLVSPAGPGVAELGDQLVRRAGGNPLYIEELLRMLIDRGMLRFTDGAWTVRPEAQALLDSVPPGLNALILARFDHLSADLRGLLRYAAGLARSFSVPIMQRIAGETDWVTPRQLDELVERQFLISERHLGDDAQRYTFRHALVRDAIYETLVRRDREVLHRRIAHALDGSDFWPDEERTELLGYHYAESDEPAAAVPLLIAAGDNAARRSAADSAIERYRRALAIMRDYPANYGDAVFRARVGLGRTLKFAGHFDAAAEVLNEALERLQVASVERDRWLAAMADVLGELADVRFRQGSYDEAVVHLENGLAVLRQADERGHRLLRSSLMSRLASIRFRQGALDEAVELARRALAAAEEADDPLTCANLYGTLGGIRWEQGALDEAIGLVERSLALYGGLGFTWGRANASTNLGVLYYAQGDWPKAIDHFQRALVLRQETGSLLEQALTLTNLGLLRMVMGDHAQAEQAFAAGVALSRRLDDGYGVIRAQIGLTHLAVIQERFADASAFLAEARALADAAGEDETIQLGWLDALVTASTGALDRALGLAEGALQLAQESGLAEQETECLRVCGTLLAQRGDGDAAERRLRESAVRARARRDPYQHALALAELGALYLADPADATGRRRLKGLAALRRSQRLLATLGAAFDLAKVRRHLARAGATELQAA